MERCRPYSNYLTMYRVTSQFGAVGLALAAYTCWVLADTGLKIVGASGVPTYEVLALVGLAEMAILLGHSLWDRNLGALWPKDPLRQFFRSCLDLANNVCVVIALRHLPLALFYILVFSAPMVTTLLAAIFLGEALAWRKMLAILGGFFGVVIAVNPFGFVRPGDWIGYLACVGCVSAFSVNMVWSRVLTQTESAESLTFCSGALMVMAGAFALLRHAAPLTVDVAAVLGATGLFCVIGSLCFFAALRHAPAAVVAQYHYSQLLTGALMAYLLWHDKLNPMMMIGAMFIIASGWYIAAASRRDCEDVPPAFRRR